MDFLLKIGKDIFINEYEISVLKKCDIDVESCNTIDEVLFGLYLPSPGYVALII